MSFFGYFNILVLLFNTYAAEVSILYLGYDVTSNTHENNTIKLIESSDLTLECSSNESNVTFTWFRNGIILTLDSKLEIQRVSIEDEGEYTCSVSYVSDLYNDLKTDRQFVFVDVLYPPSDPIIRIPDSVLVGDFLMLSCLSKSDPEPTYQWRKLQENGPLLSRNATYQLTVPSSSYRIYCNLQGLMLPTFSEPVRFHANNYVFLTIHKKAQIYNTYPHRFIYSNEGDDLYLRGQAHGVPFPKIWWTKVGDERFYVLGERLYLYNISMDDAGDYVSNAANTVIPANGTKMDIHDTYVFHVYVRSATNSNAQSPNLSCKDCLSTCSPKSDGQLTSPSNTNITYPVTTVATDRENVKSVNCTPEQQQHGENIDEFKNKIGTIPTQLILIVTSVTGWALTFVMLFITLYFYKKRVKRQGCDNMEGVANIAGSQISVQNSGTGSAYVSNVRISDSHYTDLTTYDQISSSTTNRQSRDRGDNLSYFNDTDSVSTQTSVVTYMEPVTNQTYAP